MTAGKTRLPFRVWARSLGNASRLRVEGDENARWLISRLSQSFVFKSSEPIREEGDGVCCSFQVLHGSHVSRAMVEKLLQSLPEVQLTVV